jgi:hypothetical protein
MSDGQECWFAGPKAAAQACMCAEKPELGRLGRGEVAAGGWREAEAEALEPGTSRSRHRTPDDR